MRTTKPMELLTGCFLFSRYVFFLRITSLQSGKIISVQGRLLIEMRPKSFAGITGFFACRIFYFCANERVGQECGGDAEVERVTTTGDKPQTVVVLFTLAPRTNCF